MITDAKLTDEENLPRADVDADPADRQRAIRFVRDEAERAMSVGDPARAGAFDLVAAMLDITPLTRFERRNAARSEEMRAMRFDPDDAKERTP